MLACWRAGWLACSLLRFIQPLHPPTHVCALPWPDVRGDEMESIGTTKDVPESLAQRHDDVDPANPRVAGRDAPFRTHGGSAHQGERALRRRRTRFVEVPLIGQGYGTADWRRRFKSSGVYWRKSGVFFVAVGSLVSDVIKHLLLIFFDVSDAVFVRSAWEAPFLYPPRPVASLS